MRSGKSINDGLGRNWPICHTKPRANAWRLNKVRRIFFKNRRLSPRRPRLTLLKEFRRMRKPALLFCSAASLFFFSCDWIGNPDNSHGPNKLFLAVKNTTPAFSPSSSAIPKTAAKTVASDSTPADPVMNLAFQLLRDYSYPADEGKVDMTNIYKVLYTAGFDMADAKSLCSDISPTPDSLISSYAFSDFLGHTYDCGGTQGEGGYGKSVAYRETGEDQFVLLTYKWAPEPTEQITIGAIQARLGISTGDVELTFAQTVNYPPNSAMGGASGSGFATRTHIQGNSGTHAFELKIALKNENGFYSQSLVGKGVSQGEGHYFLIRKGASYYCIPAGATEADLMNITPASRESVSAACSDYVAAVDSLAPYDTGNPAQLPAIDLSSFDKGVAGTPFKYLMF